MKDLKDHKNIDGPISKGKWDDFNKEDREKTKEAGTKAAKKIGKRFKKSSKQKMNKG